MFGRTLAVALGLLLNFATSAVLSAAQSVTVMWNANPEPDITGYRLYYGTESGVYTSQVDAPGPMAIATNLLAGETYYFAAVAYNGIGLESELSEEISYTLGAPTSGLANVSTRVRVADGEDVSIGGFIIVGQTPRTLVLRALGPSLAQAGIPGAASDPKLSLFDSTGGLIAFNDNWDPTDPVIIASGLAPTDALESILIATLPAGAYTSVLETNGSPGVTLFELYQLGSAGGVVNLSARGRVGVGDNVIITGFILTGDHPTRVVVRAIGPSLSSVGVADPLADPELQLFDGYGTLIFQNDNWRSDQEAQIVQSGLAPQSDQESAIISLLSVGNYSAVARGVDGSEGVALVEIFALP